MTLFRFYGIYARSDGFQNLVLADLRYRGGIPYAYSPDQHNLYKIFYTGKTSATGFFLVVYNGGRGLYTDTSAPYCVFPFRAIVVP
jgi:hypothetical protein